jgi:UDP-glucose-4-epimerase GalE
VKASSGVPGGVLARILVTGGAGYIGSHAVKALLDAGDDVVVYDDLSAGHAEAVEALGTAFAARGRSVVLVRGDIRDGAAVERTLKAHGATAVMHFAAWLSVGDSVNDPAGYYHNNVVGALSVLGAMVRAGVSQFIFSSTCAVIGNPSETPITEDHPTAPINSYGETKLAIERALPHYERAYGLRSIRLRYFNAAGADPDGLLGEDHAPEIHIIPRTIEALQGGDGLKVFGDDYPTPDGTCLRDYIHVTDLADAHVRALRALEAGAPSATFNVGTGEPHSVLDVIQAIERVTGKRVPYTVVSRRPGDPAVLFASNARIRRELGWEPRLASIDGIIDTAWRWHASHPHGYSGSTAGGARRP